MAQHFLDSSALLKRYRQETGSQWMLELSSQSQRLVVSRLAHVEVMAAIIRRGRQPGNTTEQVARSLAELDREMDEVFEVIELQGSVISRAMVLVKAHGLRSADAIQLGSALLSSPADPGEFHLVSADDEHNAAATRERLRVDNPQLH